jgi:hypothetical protein
MTRPLSEEGYNTLDFEGEDGAVAETFDREDARAIQEMPEPLAPVATRLPVSHTTAWVRIRKAVYDGPGKWTIQYDKSRDVTIADAEWLEKFQSNHVSAPPGSLLQVYMRVSEIELDKSGRPVKEPEYTILQVLDVRTPEQLGGQPSLFDEP